MYRTYVLIFFCVIFLGGCSPTTRTTKPAAGPFVSAGEQNLPTLSPTVSIKSKSPLLIPFVFSNPTMKQISVAVRGSQYPELVFIQSTLYRNGKQLDPDISYDAMPFTKDHVIKLAPNETVLSYCQLPFIKLAVGKYELRLTYEIPAKSVLDTEFGLTVLKLEQTIFLDVIE